MLALGVSEMSETELVVQSCAMISFKSYVSCACVATAHNRLVALQHSYNSSCLKR
jgi:hypothetical protein